ncbi:MAG TPA: isocitrate lyase/phosphoenolpyruvate mutase family protein [Bryobacteraceae bacterium]|nr:isocitrate lyase/phosphoenolpyruvate mutase family protein [Bryobacteraceae bacterium]
MPLSQAQKAQIFLEMHQGAGILVLPNAWDAASARIIESTGFGALATSSAGVANALGYPDGEKIGRAEMLEAVRRIAGAVSVPVTADLEAGYGAIEETARGAIAAGAVGLNIEDSDHRSLAEIRSQSDKIRAIRKVAREAGIPLVINARIDTYLLNFGDARERFEETVSRAAAYREAGADCLYPIGLRDGQVIGELTRAIPAPVNVMAGPGSPTIPELERLGVRRVTFGSGPMRAAMALLRRICVELKSGGTYAALEESAHLPHAEMNRLLDRSE